MIHDTEPLRNDKESSLRFLFFFFSLFLSTEIVTRKEGNESDGNHHRDVSRNVRSHDKIVDARLISSWTLHPEGVESRFIANPRGREWTRCFVATHRGRKRERESPRDSRFVLPRAKNMSILA